MTQEPTRGGPVRLFSRGLLVVILCSSVSAIARHVDGAVLICLPFSLAYVVYLLVRTWRITRRAGELGTFDAALLKVSGPLAVLPATVLLGLSKIMENRGVDIDQYVSGTDWGWFLFQCQAEFGFVLSFAVLTIPIRHRLAPRPVWLWKAVCVPFVALYFVYVVGSYTAGFGASMAK